MATALDYRPPSAESKYDPETVKMMKQMGIWHPAMGLTPGSPNDLHEKEIMRHIAEMRAHQQQLEETRTARTQGHEENLQQRRDTASLVEQGRNDRASQIQALREQVEKDRTTQGLFSAANGAGTSPAEHKMLMNEYLKRLGVSPETVAAAVPKPQGEFGPGGAQKTTTTTASSTPLEPNSTTTNPYSGPEHISMGRLGAGNTPAGYDFNLNTGDFVRKDQPGFINGKQVSGTTTGYKPSLAEPKYSSAEPTPTKYSQPTNVFAPPAAPPTAAPTAVTPPVPIGPENSLINFPKVPQNTVDFLNKYINFPKLPQQQQQSKVVQNY